MTIGKVIVSETLPALTVTIASDDATQVVTTVEVEYSVSFANAGERGPIGLTGPGGGDIDRLAEIALSAHRVVRGVSADSVNYCDANTEAHRDSLLGVTQNAASSGGTVSVLTNGPMHEPSWSWSAGLPVFCGINGVLTQTFNAAWAWSRIIGFATGATDIIVEIRDPIDLL